jgi:hypothetical protein
MVVLPKHVAEINRKLEHAVAMEMDQQAITDYNIMMGNLEDPNEEEEEEEDE